MSRSLKGAALTIAATLAGWGASAPAATLFTDRAAFLAATTDDSTDAFEHAPPGQSILYSPYNGQGFTISGSSFFGVADPLLGQDFYDWGSGDVGVFSRGGSATFTFTEARTAFGIDLMTFGVHAAAIRVDGSGFSYVVDTASRPNRTFFGLTSDQPLTGFSLHAIEGSFGVIDNFTLATAAPGNAVPEPAAWIMMILGFGAVGAGMRRKNAQVFPRHRSQTTSR